MKCYEVWVELEKVYEDKVIIKGVINGKVKGGFIVEVNSVCVFFFGFFVDVCLVCDIMYFEGKEFEFKVIKFDVKCNNVVVFCCVVIEVESSVECEMFFVNFEEGYEIKGIVKNFIDYGVFVDFGGVDGFLYIIDMVWKCVKYLSEIVNVGDEINVKVFKFDKEK